MLGYRSQVFIPVLGLVNFPLNRHNRQRPGFGTPQKMLHLADRWNYEIEKYEEPWGSEWITNCIQKLLVPAKFLNQKITTSTYIKNPWKTIALIQMARRSQVVERDSLKIERLKLLSIETITIENVLISIVNLEKNNLKAFVDSLITSNQEMAVHPKRSTIPTIWNGDHCCGVQLELQTIEFYWICSAFAFCWMF